MIKEVLALVDLTVWAEVALLMFSAVFIVVSIRTLLGSREASARHAAIVLADEPEAPHE